MSSPGKTTDRVAAIASHLSSTSSTSASTPSSSAFAAVQQAPPDPILSVAALFKADPDPSKINCGVGAYRDEQGKPYVLSCVRKAEKRIVEDPTTDHEYLPMDGLKAFTEGAAKIILGADSPVIREKRVSNYYLIMKKEEEEEEEK
ncbi:Aspartate aminotransferase, cytoplasmic, partial [Quaeritorhiza haematococci]